MLWNNQMRWFNRTRSTLFSMPYRMISDDYKIPKGPKNRMLFFADQNRDHGPMTKRPKTIQEMKKLQQFVKNKVTQPGESLVASIQKQAKRDESFNDFLKEFKAKHEKDWANIIDLTQEKQEELLLEKTNEERKDELVMLEEFRRRKNLEMFREQVYDYELGEDIQDKADAPRHEPDPYYKKRQSTGGPSKFFFPVKGEIYNPKDFTLLFLDTDSVCLVTALQRINHRRILIFVGNGNGVIGYAIGRGIDYQTAFQNAYIKLKKNLIVT